MKQTTLTMGFVMTAMLTAATATFAGINRDGTAMAGLHTAEAKVALSQNAGADRSPRNQTSQRRQRGEIYTPVPGSPERAQLMDALRSAVEPELGRDVLFRITELKITGDWAFGVLEPVRRTGAAIDIDATPLARDAGGAEHLDGLRTETIWRRTPVGWKVEAHGIGATDVWYEVYCETAPPGLITVCP